MFTATRRLGSSQASDLRPADRRGLAIAGGSPATLSLPLRRRWLAPLTRGADEKILWFGHGRLSALAGGGEPLQRAGNHALLVTVAASLLPHG